MHVFEFQNSLHWELGTTCLSVHVLSLFCFLSNKICVTHDVCICRSINNFLCLSFPMRNNPISVRTNLNQHNICVHPEGENNAYNIRLLISSIRIPSKNTHSVPTQYWFKLVLTQLRHFYQQTLYFWPKKFVELYQKLWNQSWFFDERERYVSVWL